MKTFFKILFKTFTVFLFILTILFTIVGGTVLYKTKKANLVLKQGYTPIKIYDSQQNLISTDSCYYSYVSIQDVADTIIQAFVSIEDRDFYKHNGFSTKRIIKAIGNNISKRNISQGASTITQQYVKNVFLTNEKTITRKINEIAIAFELEKRYTKDQIMEAYLNSILFGGNIYGIKMACLYYFNKEPKDISVSEACYLAGMIQAPNRYNAYKNPEAANKRKNVVLKCMLEEGYIDSTTYEKEKDISIQTLLANQSVKTSPNYLSSYLDYIYDSIEENNQAIHEIHTYLDSDIQKELFRIMQNEYNLFNDPELNCAIVVLDNATYGVKALAGNRITDRKVLNYAYDVLLQPGSTIKPILDYAPAIEYLSYGPSTILMDEEYTYHTGEIIS